MQALLATSVQQQCTVAVWRLPEQQNISVLVSFSGVQTVVDFQKSATLSGFAVTPFYTSGNEIQLVKPDMLFDSNFGDWRIQPHADRNKVNAFLRLLKKQLSSSTDNMSWFVHTSANQQYQADKTAYTKLVAKALGKIQQKTFGKVVLARQKIMTLSASVHPADLFSACLKLYRAGMVSLISAPNLGTWVGASPERLISRDKQGTIRTTALAATQPVPEHVSTSARQSWDNINWSHKARKEQAFVSRFIRDCYQRIGLKNLVEHGPGTVAAYDMLHLQTDFMIEHETTDYLPFLLLAQLHPTPAVCGMDRTAARQFILAEERFSRQLYSGYLGPVNLGGETHLFVNLRCMQFFKQTAALYAGAGITMDSVPEKEWQETELKMQTLSELLR
ncbi:isochorismate synthase [Candidatus Venteria ishoeyi]|uniref:isochorismate synthase n=1 Tax=Candidatus Venteria ishoeyi TaxID=1899563 RepID=UPI0025A5E84D|nr:isochorismate synthase [Candidatus Venteria ishoeyi]MDM8548392.1 isochorismate synthase [Candidatus Venteria ishoeyi]